MKFAHIEGGALVRFLADLPFTFKGVRGVRGLPPAQLAELGLFPVIDLTPAFDPLTIRLAKIAPAFTIFPDRVEITRKTEPIPPAEINERRAREALRDDPRAVELRDRLHTATPQQISDYVDAQVTDLAGARVMFKRILLDRALQSR